jgi:hypothetical protein
MPIVLYDFLGVMESWGKLVTVGVITLYMLFSAIPMCAPGTVPKKLLICFHLLYCYALAFCLMASCGWQQTFGVRHRREAVLAE